MLKSLVAALAGLCLSSVATANAGLVVHTASNATGGPIVLTLGTLSTIDLFISSDANDTNDINGVNIKLGIHQSGMLANPSTAPKINNLVLSGASDLLFNGGSSSVNSPTISPDGLQATGDIQVNSNIDISMGPTSALKFASIGIDATNATILPGTYKLVFEATGTFTAPTDFTRVGGSPIIPTLNDGGSTSVAPAEGITIQIVAVPEPSPTALMVLVALGTLYFQFRRKRVVRLAFPFRVQLQDREVFPTSRLHSR